jgi:hypothetical protein
LLYRLIKSGTALACLLLGLPLVINHPLGMIATGLVFAGVAIYSFSRPADCLTLMLAAVPVFGLAPWSGWLSFEETDLLVLAFATGSYAKWACCSKSDDKWQTPWPLLAFAVSMLVSWTISTGRGFADAGGFNFGWFQGYDGPMNSIRLCKALILALLLTPIVRWQRLVNEQILDKRLAQGLAIGLGLTALAVVWERYEFTGLLNFSTDYRATGPFWEMHVGGAALDGWLLITAPFAIWALRSTRSPLALGGAILLAALGAYASLVTFSRGVYLALAVSLPLLLWLLHRRPPSTSAATMQSGQWSSAGWVVGIAFLAITLGPAFQGAGYRGTLALFALLPVGLHLPSLLRPLRPFCAMAGILAGIFNGSLLVVCSNFVAKGPYLLFACLFLLTAGCLWRFQSRGAAILLGLFIGCLLAAVNVGGHWGGVEALPGMAWASLALAAIVIVASSRKQALWPEDKRWQLKFVLSGSALAGLLAVFLGGAYIGDRFSTSSKDLDERTHHWEQSIAMLDGPGDWIFGKGMGRFPFNYYQNIAHGNNPGTYGIKDETGNRLISLVSANYSLSFGDLLRISQRIPSSETGPYKITLHARAKQDVDLHLEICDKHLLYAGECTTKQIPIKGKPGEWQAVAVQMDRTLPSGGTTFRVFSFGVYSQRSPLDVDDITLATPSSSNLLSNGDFSAEMSHWFFTSDRNHMPWHAKNILVNLLFDQGLLGLSLSLLLIGSALWQLAAGKARHHELAPYLLVALQGFWIVGLFDSLLDVPRLAFVYLLLCFHALQLGSQRIRRRRSSAPRPEKAA